MESVRFFVAGLHAQTTEKELRELFQEYGKIQAVDLKTKKHQTEDELEKIIAFVTVQIDPNDVHYCLNDLNGHRRVRGAKITVTQAKESFLERLKREREEAAAAGGAALAGPASADDANASELLRGSQHNTKRVFGEDEEMDEDEIEASLLMTKKRAANSVRNGKIFIQGVDAAPIHVIESGKKTQNRKRLDKQALTADQKRKESLSKMKFEYQQKKSAIQAALGGSGVDQSQAKKIKFNDSGEEDDDGDDGSQQAAKKSQTNIFGSDDEEEGMDNGLNLSAGMLGKKGAKLAKMKSEQQSTDPRFRLDAKFVDGVGDDHAEEAEEDGALAAGGEQDELDWQMGILEQVVGTKLARSNDKSQQQGQGRGHKKMLHYDPDKAGHEKFLRNEEEVEEPTKKDLAMPPTTKKGKKAKSDVKENVDVGANGPIGERPAEVSKEVFYLVTDTLAQSLKTRGTGFSLLNMFGQAAADETIGQQREDQLKRVAHERILVNKQQPLDRHKELLRPFADSDNDTSTDEENDTVDGHAEGQTNAKRKKKSKDAKKVTVKMESFFIPRNDARLKDGAKFFLHITPTAATPEDYDAVRNRLKLIIKTKIAKTKKQLAAAGVKGNNKRRRRF